MGTIVPTHFIAVGTELLVASTLQVFQKKKAQTLTTNQAPTLQISYSLPVSFLIVTNLPKILSNIQTL